MPGPLIEGKMLIDGQLVESQGGAWLDTINPATEEVIGRVPMGTAADMEQAVEAAERAQVKWADTSMADRIKMIRTLSEAIEARGDEIAKIEVMDTGNTIKPMRKDVTKAVERMNFYAGIAYEMKGDTVPSTPGNIHMTMRVPYGVVGRIIPFNHPIGFAASRLAPALIAGNAIIIKPSEQSPLSACILGELCAEHLPPGIVNIVTGGRETGEALVRHPRVKRIAFIGSVASGMAIQKAAAETAVKHVTLELGGKNPMIVFPDAGNLQTVAKVAVAAMNFGWQGQSCGSMSRLFLHDDIHDEVVDGVLEAVKAIKVGDPLDGANTMGPINSAAQYEKVMSYIKLGQDEGAKLVLGGKRPEGKQFEKGNWVEPTVFTGVKQSMRIANEEIFGPVMSIMRWSDTDEMVRDANAVDYGLTASIWSEDYRTALGMVQRINAGYIWVNGAGPHYRGLPYGGFKNSGTGREEGIEELLSYTEVKAVSLLLDEKSAFRK